MRAWVFDLDHTLYPLKISFGEAVTNNITDYVQHVTGLPRDEAFVYQKQLLDEYGSTFSGLVLKGEADVQQAIKAIYDRLDISCLSVDEDLVDAIAALEGKKYVFTNSAREYSVRILNQIGLHEVIDDLHTVEDCNFIVKPNREAFDALLKRLPIDPTNAVMVEDRIGNLKIAKELGMTTVYVGHPCDPEPYVDHVTDNLAAWLKENG